MIAGVEIYFLGKKWEDTSNQLCHDHGSHQRAGNHNCKSWIVILYKDTYTVGNSKKSTDDRKRYGIL